MKLVDLSKDPEETNNLINNPEYAEMVKSLEKAIKDNPEKDSDPIYEALSPQEWDLKIRAKSQEWKKGKPGDEIKYVPDSQGAGQPNKRNNKDKKSKKDKKK